MTKYINKDFTKEYLTETLGLPHDSNEVIEDTIYETSRWTEKHEIIFKDTDGKVYQTWYGQGLTELQDESPWEYEDIISCREMIQVEKTITTWVAKVES